MMQLSDIRNEIRADWERRNWLSARSSVDVAVLQHLLGLSRQADGLMGPHTRERVLAFINGRWAFTPSTDGSPDHICESLTLLSDQLARRLGGGREAVLQAVLGLPLTGLLGSATKSAALDFIEKTWAVPGPPFNDDPDA